MASETLNRTYLNFWATHRVLARHFWRFTYSGFPVHRRKQPTLPVSGHLRRDIGLPERMSGTKQFQHWV